MPSLVRCTNISRSLSATQVSIPIISLLTLGSVFCKKDSLGEHEISGEYSSIALIASRVSQKVLPTRESSYTNIASIGAILTISRRSKNAFLFTAGTFPLTAESSKKSITW